MKYNPTPCVDAMQFLKSLLALCLIPLLAGCDVLNGKGEVVRKQMVVFASDRGGGGNMNVWMMNPDGTGLRQLTHYADGDYWPADISPDGKRILFYRLDDFTFVSAIYVMDVSGPEPGPEEAIVPGLSAAGNFFPDGHRFVFEQYLTNLNQEAVFVHDLRDGSSVQVSPDSVHSFNPRVSPDGKLVCYSALTKADEWGRVHQLFVMDLTEGSARALSPAEGGYTGHCTFSPHGDTVFFSTMGDLHWVSLPDGQLRRIEKQGYDDYPYPDTAGARLFFRQGGGDHSDTNSEILSINLDGSGLKRLTYDKYQDDKPIVGVAEFRE